MSPLAQKKLRCQPSTQRIAQAVCRSCRTGKCGWRAGMWPHSSVCTLLLLPSPAGSWHRRSLQSSVWCSCTSLQPLNSDLTKLSILFTSCVVTGNHLEPDKYWVIYSTFCHSEGSWQIFLLGYLVCNNFFFWPKSSTFSSGSRNLHPKLPDIQQVICAQEPTQCKAASFPFLPSNNYFKFILQWKNGLKIGSMLEPWFQHPAKQISVNCEAFLLPGAKPNCFDVKIKPSWICPAG